MRNVTLTFTLSPILILIFACSHDGALDPGNNQGGTRATFSSIQSNVLSTTCAVSGCHNGTQPPNMSGSVAYSNLVNVGNLIGTLDYIEPNNADNSYLYRKVTGQNIVGKRMPENGPPYLSTAVTDSIKAWIDAGAPNN